MLVADTSLLIDHLRGDPGATSAVAAIDAAGDQLATTFVNAYEFLVGTASRSEKARGAALGMLERLLILDGDIGSARLASQASAELLRRGERVSATDMLIAGIVLRENAVLLTRDNDFARVPGLAIKAY